MKKNFFSFVFLLFFVLIIPDKSNSYSSNPKEFISDIVDEAKKILIETNSKEFKTKKLSEMALKVVDIKGIGFYSLGSYRKDLSDEQLKEYMKLFEKYFLKSFTSRLSDYSDPKIDVLQADVINPKYTMVKSLLFTIVYFGFKTSVEITSIFGSE